VIISPLVSVIMNCYNSSKYLREAIDSVYAQTYENWEIVFWDNASMDNSAEIALSYDAKLRYFRGEETVPLGMARNKAIEQANGKFIAFLDCDDIWLPRKLEVQLPLFKDPNVGLVYSDTIFFNEKGRSKRLYSNKYASTGYCFRELLSEYCLSLETVIIRRAALEGQTQWFDPRFNLIEEADLFIRIAYNWKVSMLPEPLSKWRIHGSSGTWTKMYEFYGETMLMLDKYAGLFPDFEQSYSGEIQRVKINNTLRHSAALWQNGQGYEARKQLSNLAYRNINGFFLYFLSFLPPHHIVPILRRLRGDITPT